MVNLLRIIAVVCLALIVVVAGCTSTTPPAAKEKMEKITVGYSSVVSSQALGTVTKEAGLFEKNGLDVELVYVAGGSPAVKALLSGDIQFAEVAGPSVVEAYVNGADVAILIGRGNFLDHKLIVKGIDKPSDLKGKKLGILRFGDLTETATRFYLKDIGLEVEKDVALIQVGGQGERVAAMAAGAIDGTVVTEPEATRAKRQGFKEIGNIQGFEYQAGTLSTTKSVIKSRPETTKKFVKAITEGVHFWKMNKEATVKTMADFLKLQDDVEAVEIPYKAYAASMQPAPYPTFKGVQAILDELKPKYEKAKTIKPEEIIDASFIKELEDSGFIKKLYGN